MMITNSCFYLRVYLVHICFNVILGARHSIVFESNTVAEVVEGEEDNTEYLLSCDIADVESFDDIPGYNGQY